MTAKKIFALWLFLAVLTLCFVSCERVDPSPDDPNDTAVCGHVYSEWETVVPATCTEMGRMKGVCTLCGREETIITPTSSHDFEVLPFVAPSCTEEGRTSGVVCRNCGLVEAEQLILPATGHTEVMDPGKAPTCAADGFTDGKHCTGCGEITVPQTPVPAAGHSEITDLGKEATCTEDGLTEGKHCSRCGEITVSQTVIPAKGHTEEALSRVEPTCTAHGLTEGVRCSACEKTLSGREDIPAKGHTVVVDPRVEPTCTEDGLSEGQHCSVCHHVLYEQVVRPATGHTEVTDGGKDPTCTEDGLTEGKHCSVCGTVTVLQTSVPATGHTEVILDRVEPTCTEQGWTAGSICSTCGETLSKRTPVAALGHITVIDPAKEPTCTEDGLTEGKHCRECGDTIVEQILLPAPGHRTVVLPSVPATCTEDGLTDGSACDRCGEVFAERTVVKALGHDYDEGGACVRCDAAVTAEGLVFESLGDGKCRLVGIGTCTDAHIVIPRVSPEGDVVVAVDRNAFYDAVGLSSVAIPNTVTDADALCSRLSLDVEIYFIGTRAEWYAVGHMEGFTEEIVTRYIHCSDGDVFMCGAEVEDMGFAFTSNGDGTCYVSGVGTATRGVIPRYSPAGDLVTAIGEGALAESIFYLIGLPDSVTRIEARAFYQADFAYAVLPDTVTYIGDYAFYQLTGPGILWTGGEQISRMTGLTYLGKYALALCPHTGGISLTLPEGVTAVEDGLVSGGYWCAVTLTLPKSVTYIGADIFTGWSSTASITYRGTVEEWRAIEKHGGWNNRMPPITVTCTDGEVVTEDRYISIDGT